MVGDTMTKVDNFKEFVKKNQVLVTYVKENKMTWQKFYELYDLYGEDNSIWDKYVKEEEKPIIIRANKPGTIKKIHALEVAKLSYQLGALRTTKDEKIDYNAGVYIERKIGDKIAPGDVLMKLYTIKKIDNINLDLIFEISLKRYFSLLYFIYKGKVRHMGTKGTRKRVIKQSKSDVEFEKAKKNVKTIGIVSIIALLLITIIGFVVYGKSS